MYDKSTGSWVAYANSVSAEGFDEQTVLDFEKADAALVSALTGEDNAEAVYLMEKSAKAGLPDACFAMAQMFEYGWAVKKSKRQAYRWYQKAADAGNLQAGLLLKKHRRAQRIRLIVIAAAVVLCAALGFGVFFALTQTDWFSGKKSGTDLKLPQEATYHQPTNAEDYGKHIYEDQQQFDNEDMMSGKETPYRILLVYEGEELDLSAYHVVSAINDGDMITLQFENEQDAKDCLAYLQTLEGTVAAGFDTYTEDGMNDTEVSLQSQSYSPVYHSTYTNADYYSWGAEAMGFDAYSAYLQSILPSDHHLTVGIIDSGIEPQPDTEARILEGFDFFEDTKGLVDHNGHGTHVSGTILDCTQGLNIDVMPFTIIFPNKRNTSDSYMILGVKKAMEAGVDVINMSVGGGADENSSVFETYVNRAIDSGIVFVTSAGNDAVDASLCTPSRVDRCITVSAIDERFSPADFTNYGSVIDVCAPGVDVLSYYPQPEGMAYLSGTSMASPHVAALAAMMQLEFHESPEVINFYVTSYCRNVGSNSTYFGAGLPDGSRLVE